MTVGELIEQLKFHDPNLPVVVPGRLCNEEGYEGIKSVAAIHLIDDGDDSFEIPRKFDSSIKLKTVAIN